MIPFILLLGFLWLVAEVLESTFSERTVVAPPVGANQESP